MTIINIACATDDSYVPHTAAMLHSLRTHNSQSDIFVHFLYGSELSSAKRRKLQTMLGRLGLRHAWHFIDDRLVANLPNNVAHISKVVWYRLFMPQLLFELDKVLYVDSDVIVMDSITPLFEIAIGENYFAAVTNAMPKLRSDHAQKIGLPNAESYFNAGIVMWNLEPMRREGFTERVLTYSRKHGINLLWNEQDVVNILYHDRRHVLHPRWNCQNGIFLGNWGAQNLFNSRVVAEATNHPAMVHFEGGQYAKPWHLMCKHPLKKAYIYHRRRTPWPFYVPNGITLRNIATLLLPDSLLRKLKRMRRKLKPS